MAVQWYCDFSSGNDTTGSGTTGSPYKTTGKCVSVCNGGDTINISNVAAEVLTTSISWTGSGATTAIAAATPLTIQAWNNGGSITIANPVGNILAAELNGNSAVASIFATASMPSYVTLVGLKMHGTTSSAISPQIYWNVHQCEFYAIAGTSTTMLNCTSGENTVTNCYFHDDTGTTVTGVAIGSSSLIYGCYFSGLSGYSVKVTGNTNAIISNIIKCGKTGGLNVLGILPWIFNNTIVGDGTASQVGITLSSANHRSMIINNIITDISGTSAIGINFAGSTTGANAYLFGNNSLRNNTTNYSNKLVFGIDITANDVTETSTPYVSAGTGNYGLVTGALSIAAAFPKGVTGSATLEYIDNGGAQKQITGGGTAATVGSAYAT